MCIRDSYNKMNIELYDNLVLTTHHYKAASQLLLTFVRYDTSVYLRLIHAYPVRANFTSTHLFELVLQTYNTFTQMNNAIFAAEHRLFDSPESGNSTVYTMKITETIMHDPYMIARTQFGKHHAVNLVLTESV